MIRRLHNSWLFPRLSFRITNIKIVPPFETFAYITISFRFLIRTTTATSPARISSRTMKATDTARTAPRSSSKSTPRRDKPESAPAESSERMVNPWYDLKKKKKRPWRERPNGKPNRTRKTRNKRRTRKRTKRGVLNWWYFRCFMMWINSNSARE